MHEWENFIISISAALNSLVEQGKKEHDFQKAENYCLEQSENLLALLFEKIISIYNIMREEYYEKK